MGTVREKDEFDNMEKLCGTCRQGCKERISGSIAAGTVFDRFLTEASGGILVDGHTYEKRGDQKSIYKHNTIWRLNL